VAAEALARNIPAFSRFRRSGELHYGRSTSGFEVDFILINAVAIGVKAKSVISPQDLKGLRALKEEEKMSRYLLVCLESVPRQVDFVEVKRKLGGNVNLANHLAGLKATRGYLFGGTSEGKGRSIGKT